MFRVKTKYGEMGSLVLRLQLFQKYFYTYISCNSIYARSSLLFLLISFFWTCLQFIWQLDSQPIIEVSSLARYAIGQYVDGNSGDVISHLNITHVRPEDGGLYKCSASNSMGNAEHSSRLNVYGELTQNITNRFFLTTIPPPPNFPSISCYFTYKCLHT